MKSYLVKSLIVFLCTCLLLALIGVHTVYAAGNIVVNSTADTSGGCSTSGTGTCTLRDAITYANSNAGADTIIFDASFSGATITLSSTLPAIADDLTIDASSLSSMITISGNNFVQVMIVNSGKSLTINKINIINGRDISGKGGGIYNNGALTIIQSVFSGNLTAGNGGGIYNNGTLTVNQCIFSGNQTIFAYNANGGGIYVESGTVNITSSTFSGSLSTYAAYNGGGIFIEDGTVNISDSTFSSNAVPGSGGGIHNHYGTLTLTRCTFTGNHAYYRGGGIYNDGTMTITTSTFSSNMVTGEYPSAGGGIFNNSYDATIDSSTISNNTAPLANGGGIFTAGMMRITGSTISGNSAKSYGGGIYSSSGTLFVVNTTLYGNRVTHASGGGIYNNVGNLNLFNSTVSNNSAPAAQGGGLYFYRGESYIANTIIANSTNGGDCVRYEGVYPGYLGHDHMLIEDSTYNCGLTDGVNSDIIGSDPHLGSLANNGGNTETMATLSGSPAIDAGNDDICSNSYYLVNNSDQRGVTRPEGAHCDIGAYEHAGGIPKVISSVPANNARVTSLTTIKVTFSEDMIHDGSDKAANNIANYLLVERGANSVFDTLSCLGGAISDDITTAISSASYNDVTFTSTLTLPVALTSGTYRLFVCGSASIWNMTGLALNNGKDTEITFMVPASGSAAALPATGFPIGQVSLLPPRSLSNTYGSTDLVLVIPALNVKAAIVGVPRSDDSWDVSWLGKNVGWLNGSAYPTWKGNTVLTGHVWNANNTPGIFVNLNELKYGDRFEIKAYGQTYIYEVRESRLISKWSVNTVFMHKDRDWVTLLSCEQYDALIGKYHFRRVVRAVLIEVQ